MRGVTVNRAVITRKRHRSNYRDVGRDGPRGLDSLRNLIEIGECFEDEHVHARICQSRELLTECFKSLLWLDSSIGCKPCANWPDGSCDVNLFIALLRHASSKFDGLLVDCNYLIRKAICRQFETVGAEGIRFNQFGPGLNEGPVNGCHALWLIDIEFVKAGIKMDAMLMQHRAHCAVRQQWPLFQSFDKSDFRCH